MPPPGFCIGRGVKSLYYPSESTFPFLPTWRGIPWKVSLTLTGWVVVKDGVLAEGFVAPGHHHVLQLCRGAVVTLEDDSGKQGGVTLNVLHCHQQWEATCQHEHRRVSAHRLLRPPTTPDQWSKYISFGPIQDLLLQTFQPLQWINQGYKPWLESEPHLSLTEESFIGPPHGLNYFLQSMSRHYAAHNVLLLHGENCPRSMRWDFLGFYS